MCVICLIIINDIAYLRFWISYTMDRHNKIPQDYRMLKVLKGNIDSSIGSTTYKRMLTFKLSKAHPNIKMIKFLLDNKADPNKIIESKSLLSPDSDSDDSSSDQKISATATHALYLFY